MAGTFELKAAGQDQFRFSLKAGNHQTILTSQSYASKAS
ncbi:YegP family protein, partial [Sphaerotilus sp.]